MTIEVLSSKESLSLCRDAATLVLEGIRGLAHRAGPSDRPLRSLFEDMTADLEKNLLEIGVLEGRNAGIRDEKPGQQTARGFLPSLAKSRGTDGVDRESGFYMAECILGDLSGFYGALVRQTNDEGSRDLLERSKRAVESRLDFLRRVVL